MGGVMIACPSNGEAVWTGIDTDAESFKRFPSLALSIACRACGGQHTWSKADAWLCDPLPFAVVRAA